LADSGETLYYWNDAKMNVTALANTAGTVVERCVYDPYGTAIIYNQSWGATVAWGDSKKNEILYCGYQYVQETELYYVRYRMYHPALGRWMQRDLLRYLDQFNLYLAAGANPT